MSRILVIDDAEDVREVLMAALSAAGHEVVLATGGDDGIAQARTQDFDLVITDILMPDRDGIEVITALFDLPKRPPIVAMSGGGAMVPADIALGGARFSAQATLMKPFDVPELLETVQRVLAEKA